jgi:hypothetical protein
MSILTTSTRSNIPGDSILHSHRRENLKSYNLLSCYTDSSAVNHIVNEVIRRCELPVPEQNTIQLVNPSAGVFVVGHRIESYSSHSSNCLQKVSCSSDGEFGSVDVGDSCGSNDYDGYGVVGGCGEDVGDDCGVDVNDDGDDD